MSKEDSHMDGRSEEMDGMASIGNKTRFSLVPSCQFMQIDYDTLAYGSRREGLEIMNTPLFAWTSFMLS